MYKKIILENGLKIIIAPLKETKAVTVLVLVRVGSRYETKKINGVSHFIEHMMFKGTKKRPDILAISKELDRVGAEYNAYTSKDHTGYYVKISAEKLELALDILSDMIWQSKFDKKEFEKEKGVIVEEINMYEDNPLMHVESLLEERLYQGNTLGWQISGSRQTVLEMKHQEMLAYKDNFYKFQNMVLGVAGRVDKKTLALIKKYFGKYKTKIQSMESHKKEFDFSIFKSKKNIAEDRLIVNFKKTEQVQLALGFPGLSYNDSDIYALSLLAIILGGNMSSRLFIEVRQKRSLAYFVKTFLNVYEDTGGLVVQAGLDCVRVEEAIRVILGELKKVRVKGVKALELKNAKEFIKGQITLELEDSSSLAEWLVKQDLLTQKILTPEEKLKKVFRVSGDDIKRVARKIILEENLYLALIGPFKEKNKFLRLMKI